MAKVVILSTADMKSAVWTNKQHLAVRLAALHETVYIESLGLRKPRLARKDLQRIFARIYSPSSVSKEPNQASKLLVVKPHVIPFHSNRIISFMNGIFLRTQIRRLLAGQKSKSVLWTFSPVTYNIEGYFDRVVYHSVDLLHEIRGLPADLLLTEERRLVEKADVVIASSRAVHRHLTSLGVSDVRLWENVADTELYMSANPERLPRAVFAGNLTPGKVDFELLLAVAETGVDVVLAGPVGIDGTQDDGLLSRLLAHKRISYVGNLPPLELAELLNSCTVGLIPYLQNPYTAGVFPMKVYEYLASGLTVVATPLPSLSEVDEPSIIIADNDHFGSEVLNNIHSSFARVADNRLQSRGHSWVDRTAQAHELLQELAAAHD